MTATTGASAPSVFQFQSLDVRAFADDAGEPWFCAADVCAVLGYRNDSDAIAKHCRTPGVAKRDLSSGGQMREMTFINEGNLYRLIIKSRKPEAQAFEQQVMEVILPAIRKTGRYDHAAYAVNPSDTLTADEADLLRTMLRDAVALLPGDRRAAFMIAGWSKLKAHFGVSYRSIPRAEFEEAVSILARHVADQTPAQVTQQPCLPSPAPTFASRRWLIAFDRNGRESAVPLEPEHFLIKIAELPELIRDPGFMIDGVELLEVIRACSDRMAAKIGNRTTRRIA